MQNVPLFSKRLDNHDDRKDRPSHHDKNNGKGWAVKSYGMKDIIWTDLSATSPT